MKSCGNIASWQLFFAADNIIFGQNVIKECEDVR